MTRAAGKDQGPGCTEKSLCLSEGHKALPHDAVLFTHNLKILPNSHSTATWCIMVNVSMWCLPTNVYKEWCARYYYRNDKDNSEKFESQFQCFFKFS